jgi:predicted permease
MAPTFTLFSILALGLGIGATAAIYSVIHAAILQPLDVKEIDRVVNIYHSDPTRGMTPTFLMSLSSPDYQDLRSMQTSFSEVAAWSRFRHAVVSHGTAEVVLGEMVSGNYFQLFGVSAALGRTLLPADDEPGALPVVVLSDGFWRRRLDADPAIVGKSVRIGRHSFEVVGVAPPSFRGVDMPNILPTAAWVPLARAPLMSIAGNAYTDADRSNRERRWLMVKARLKPGRTLAQAAADVTSIGRNLDASFPLGRDLQGERRFGPEITRAWFVMPTADVRVHESVHQVAGPMAGTAMAAVGLVLLVACTNLANLMLARGSSRRHELAVRLALGASRFRLVREQVIESALVAVLGGLAAFGIARLLMVTVFSAAMQAGSGLLIQLSPSLNPSVMAVATAATLLALLVFGVGPALHLTRGNLRGPLSADTPTVAVPRWRGRHNLVAGQVAVSVVLVALAAACVEQIALAARHDWGMDMDRLALVRVDFKLKNEDEESTRRTLEALLERTRAQPGVEVAAFSSGLPASGSTRGAMLSSPDLPVVAGQPRGRHAELITGTPTLFRAFGLRIARGRAFDERDTAASLSVALLSESAAIAVFGSTDVVGRQVMTQGRQWAGEAPPPHLLRTVIGVVADVRRFGRRQSGVLYLPFAQHYEPAVTIVARVAGDPESVVGPLRRLTTQVAPDLPIIEAGTGMALGGGGSLALEVTAGVAGLLGALALVLSMAGLYGVTHLVLGRTREIGVRMALGAGPERVLRSTLWDGTRPVLEGLLIGFAVSVLARMSLLPMFGRVLPVFNSAVLLALPVPFLLAALLACYVPARRAAGVDPNIALRHL